MIAKLVLSAVFLRFVFLALNREQQTSRKWKMTSVLSSFRVHNDGTTAKFSTLDQDSGEGESSVAEKMTD